uniref:UBC core domain-containing protein n=1 Tax=Nelumbo nucifera TaxID=4432 RepID=A0A822Y6L6_NELNU|nr:TPA_asm: hypothetical protein HUJ06_029141 [Nelumbo nucifera]
MAKEKYNLKNPVMQANPSDIFEWQFAIRGPRDTEFEGGIYHGRIQLLAEYPFQPLPSWSVRTALVALIAFMPTNPDGVLGSLDYKKEERCALAIKFRETTPRFGTPERQKLIDEIHQCMLSKAPPILQLNAPQASNEEESTEKEVEAEVSPQNSGVQSLSFAGT